jgi:diguanylate cyclase (GGDEF)-like protein
VDDSAGETIEFRSAETPPEEPAGRSFCLIVMHGPDKGATFPLPHGVHTIGRAPDCDITVTGRGVSRTHAAVQVQPHGDVLVEDRGSTNGVFVDAERVTRPRQMEPGQTLGLGPEVKLRLEMSSGSVQSLLREMYKSATMDSLTGLLTRRGFEEHLEVEFAMVKRHQTSSCLAVLDLDRFKAINDREGHEAGDVVLRTVADHVKASVRTGDLACRWGGEEITLYIRQTPLIGAVTLLERLRKEVADCEIALPNGNRLRVTFSAGLIDLLEFQDWKTGFRRADEALYQAKAEGRNRVVFFSS